MTLTDEERREVYMLLTFGRLSAMIVAKTSENRLINWEDEIKRMEMMATKIIMADETPQAIAPRPRLVR